MPGIEPAPIHILNLADRQQDALFEVFRTAFDQYRTWEIEKAKLGEKFAGTCDETLVADLITLIDTKGKENAYRAVGADEEMVEDALERSSADLQDMVKELGEAAKALTASSIPGAKRRAEMLLGLSEDMTREGPYKALDNLGCSFPEGCYHGSAVAAYIAAMFYERPEQVFDAMSGSHGRRYMHAVVLAKEKLQNHLEQKGVFADAKALDRYMEK
jgi:hypothetical protein